MSIEAVIRTHLLADAGVTALVSTRIWQLKLPQSPSLPAVRVQVISEPKGYQLRGPDGATRARVQVDSVADESAGYTQLDTIALAVDAALSGATFTSGSTWVTGCFRDNRRSMYDPQELRQIVIAQDYIVWHKAL